MGDLSESIEHIIIKADSYLKMVSRHNESENNKMNQKPIITTTICVKEDNFIRNMLYASTILLNNSNGSRFCVMCGKIFSLVTFVSYFKSDYPMLDLKNNAINVRDGTFFALCDDSECRHFLEIKLKLLSGDDKKTIISYLE